MRQKTTKTIIVNLLLLLVFIVAFGWPKTISANNEQATYDTNSFIIVLTNEESLKGISYEKDFFENIGCSELNELTYSSQTEQAIQEKNKEYKRIFQIIVDNNNLDNLDMLIDYANDLPYVYAAEYNYYLETCASPNDTYYYEQEYYLGMEYFEETWDFVTGNNNVKVAIIDSGIDITHSDLCNRVDQNLSCSFINGIITIKCTWNKYCRYNRCPGK